MAELTAVIEGVYNDGARIDIKAGGKKLTTFKEDLGRIARSLEGQECVISYTSKTRESNGKSYTNWYFDGAKPVEKLPEPEPPAWTGDSNEQRRQDIRWQVAFKAAVELADKPDVDLESVFALCDVIYAGLSRRQA